MTSLTQSPFLQALGYAIINSLWQFALLWLIYMVVNTVCRLSSHKSYATALMLQVVGFAWFIGTLLYYYNFCIQLSLPVQTLDMDYRENITELSSLATLKENVYAFLVRAEHLLPYLSLAYLFLIVFLTIKMGNGFRKSIQLRSQGLIKSKVEWRLFVQRISFELGLKQTVRLYLSYFVQSPVTIGFFKPIILLPVAAVNHLSTEQLEAILLHELAHIKRHDYLINLLVLLIELTLFFNPFMQLLSRQIKRERENSCDDWVLQYEYNASTYAKALLKIAAAKVNSCPQFAMAATDNKRVLLSRVKRMIEKKDNPFNYRQQLVALIFMTALFVSVAWFVPAKNNKVVKTSSLKMQKPVEEDQALILAKIDNPLFNPVYFLTKSIDENDKKCQPAAGKETKKQETNITVKQIRLNVEDSGKVRSMPRKTFVATVTAPLKQTDEDLFERLSIDTALLGIELKKLSGLSIFQGTELKTIQTQVNEINSSISASQRIAARSFVNINIEKAQKQALEAIEKFDKLKTAYYTNWHKVQGTNSTKGPNKRSNNTGLEHEIQFKTELKALSDKIRSLDVLNKMQLLIEKPARNSTYQVEMPAVFYTPEYKPAKSYSYEYKVAPKSHLIVMSKSLREKVKTDVKKECRTVSEEYEHVKDCTPPIPPVERRATTTTSKRLYIVHI